MAQQQQMAPNLPYPVSFSSGSSGSGSSGFAGSTAAMASSYPGLAEYMGLELSESVIRANMPEYLPENQARSGAIVPLQTVNSASSRVSIRTHLKKG